MSWNNYDAAGKLLTSTGGQIVSIVTASSPLASSGGSSPNISVSNQSANIVLAGPSSGAAAAPDFRALVADDLSAALPKRASMNHDESTVVTGNPLSIGATGTQLGGGTTSQSAAAQNDEFTHSFVIAAGTYTIYFFGVTQSNCGILTVYIDGVSVGTVDFYSAGATSNVTKSIASVVLTAGYHRLNGKVATKNASASDYNMFLTKYYLKQSSD